MVKLESRRQTESEWTAEAKATAQAARAELAHVLSRLDRVGLKLIAWEGQLWIVKDAQKSAELTLGRKRAQRRG